MTSGDSLQQYATLLGIRLRAARRDVIVARWLFLIAMAGFFAFGVLGRLRGASAFVAAFFVVAFGAGYFAVWSRCETARVITELIDVLRREVE